LLTLTGMAIFGGIDVRRKGTGAASP
jgi:hypothetical protein